MSVEALAATFQLRVEDYVENDALGQPERFVGPTGKLILLALADHAGKDDSGAWPSIEHLAWKVSLNRRTVQRNLRELEHFGLVVTTQRTGTSSYYRLAYVQYVLGGHSFPTGVPTTSPADPQGDPQSGGGRMTPPGRQDDARGAAQRRPESSRTTNEPDSGSPQADWEMNRAGIREAQERMRRAATQQVEDDDAGT